MSRVDKFSSEPNEWQALFQLRELDEFYPTPEANLLSETSLVHRG